MKNWSVADVVELNIASTEYGKNLNANEANALKGKKNNGAGGSLNVTLPGEDVIPEGDKSDDTVTPNDRLS